MKSSNESVTIKYCEKHRNRVEKTRDKIIETRKTSNLLGFQQIFNKGYLSLTSDGLFQKYTLKEIVKQKLLNCGYDYINYYDEVIEEMFKSNPIVMPIEEQIQTIIWIQGNNNL